MTDLHITFSLFPNPLSSYSRNLWRLSWLWNHILNLNSTSKHMKSYRVTPNISQNECFFLALWEIFFNMNKQNKLNKFWSDGSSQKKTVQLYNLVLLHRMLYVNYSSWSIRIMYWLQIHTYVNAQLCVGALDVNYLHHGSLGPPSNETRDAGDQYCFITTIIRS